MPSDTVFFWSLPNTEDTRKCDVVGLITLKECSLAYPGTVILTVQSMRGINVLLSHQNSQEFKDSQQLIFNPSEFLQYLRPCKPSSLHIVHMVHIVH